MRKVFGPLAALTGLMFVGAPFMVARAPYESSMGLVQKIFYFHVHRIRHVHGDGVCGVGHFVHLFRSVSRADRPPRRQARSRSSSA
jgi:hypothetical protein